MAYQSLYRRYRPQRFSEVVGQDHVVRALRNAVADDRVSHAYLFSGPRGTGKTSTARILAKALNCLDVHEGEPCGRCESCVAIASSSSVDVHELDAASNNGVDAMRDLVARAALATPGRWKVYIVDEVHMLSAGASNALLKTLEEPPGHVVFVLATTDPQKVLPTVRSRTQHFEFRLLPTEMLGDLLRRVADDAGIDVTSEALETVARRGAGSARDALSGLDQVAASGGEVEDAEASTDELVEALCERDAGQALVALAAACAAGRDPRKLTRELVEHLRAAFLSLMAKDLVVRAGDELARVEDQARRLGPAAAVRAIEVLGEALVAMRDAVDPRITLEAALVRLARADADASPAALLARIERLERAVDRSRSDAGPGEVRGSAAGSGAAAGRTPGSGSGAASGSGPEATGGRSGPWPPGPPPPEARSGPPSRTSPAREARAVLGASRTSGPPAPPSPSPPPSVPPSPSSPSPPGPPSPAGSAARRPGASPPTSEGPLPTRDELVLAWPEVLTQLRGAKARFMAGRFLAVENGAAVFALPNDHHRRRCEESKTMVEAVLAAHLGRRIPVRLVVDPGSFPPDSPPEQGSPPSVADEDIDLSELQDAPAALTSCIHHVTQAFPGAELVEE